MTRIGVLGAGAWGTAIAKVLAENGHDVGLWSFEPDVTNEINDSGLNSRYLIGVDLPRAIKATDDILEAASGKDAVLITVPSPFIIDAIKRILGTKDVIEGRTLIGVLSKGFVQTASGVKFIVDAIEDYLPGIYKGNIVYISGPSHAEEVARGKLTGLITASRNGRNAIRLRELLANERLLVFSSLDVRGVQISAAMKNVIAIAFGIMDALAEFTEHIGDNTESLLLAAGLNEIQNLGVAMGASHPETFTSIAGVGDLDVTCRGRYGRNRRFGREIIVDHILDKFAGIDDIIDRMADVGYFAEGVVATKFVFALAEQHNLSLPICRGVYGILNKQFQPLQAIDTILSRLGREASGRYR
jgi:glycerol-3-phosphate dehydrogenase (NAD(P)+)